MAPVGDLIDRTHIHPCHRDAVNVVVKSIRSLWHRKSDDRHAFIKYKGRLIGIRCEILGRCLVLCQRLLHFQLDRHVIDHEDMADIIRSCYLAHSQRHKERGSDRLYSHSCFLS